MYIYKFLYIELDTVVPGSQPKTIVNPTDAWRDIMTMSVYIYSVYVLSYPIFKRTSCMINL